ncbi:ankyrin repeat domain-containing protein [Dyadobacter sp. CY347]|uniref:ankyrin repeat domain-containing protein n=1 Tax=Dyadobacter sp. CY347 TaxID=2909336 RepID=UPI001F2DF1F4|nr:ankyrin repeat domain-containing protein [Dyadobacter sp. CY347]MCF2491340.1 ankyrin repeat domain-containing protein [Dyadobacter sp. CY347]
MLLQETALEQLSDSGVNFTMNEFRRSITQRFKDPIFDLFIQAGIVNEIKSPDGILRLCIRSGSAEKMQILLSQLNLEILSPELFFELIDRAAFEQYDTPESAAASQWKHLAYSSLHKVKDVNFLKEKQIRIHNHVVTEEQTPLRLAVFMRDPQLVHLLIKNGALADAKFSEDTYLQGGNLLHFIAAQKETSKKDILISGILISAGVEINAKNKNLYTPLALCAQNGSLAMAKFLVSKGAFLDEKVGLNADTTILMEGIRHKNYAITQFLLDHGADVHYRDKNGWTAARLAFNRRNRETGEAIISKGAVVRPFIGLNGSPSKTAGILVEVLDTTASGSAYSSGIRINDIIIEVDFQPIDSMPSLINVITAKRPLDTITMTVIRENTTLNFIVEIQAI